ncbi:hypothetical protein M728_001073 [Ensifer sp. WSM1721]|uniref:hypothetical protein n=1 Tax=Ensifer sp. WSM1721 TaxID=1041159 RepID=UPI00047CFE89|nr:hypothetical protein [Ensifer sp. WSM1721]
MVIVVVIVIGEFRRIDDRDQEDTPVLVITGLARLTSHGAVRLPGFGLLRERPLRMKFPRHGSRGNDFVREHIQVPLEAALAAGRTLLNDDRE